MTIKELVETCTPGMGQVLCVTLCDTHTAEILFREMRAEGFLKLINPELTVEEWCIRPGKMVRTRYNGPLRQMMTLFIGARVMSDVPNYYTDEEWDALKAGTLKPEVD